MAETKTNIFFFYGADTYRSRQKFIEWREAFVRKYGQGSVREVEKNEEGGGITLSSIVGGVSLFSPTMLTIVRDPWPSGTAKGGLDTDDFLTLAEKGFAGGFVLLWQRGGLDKRLTATKKLLELGKSGKIQLQEFAEMSDEEALKFAAVELKKYDLQLKRDAGELLVQFCRSEQGGIDSWSLAGSIAQLGAYCRGKEIVAAEDVSTVIAPRESGDKFLPALQSFAKNNAAEFLKYLDALVRNAGAEQELLGLLAAVFEQVKNMLVVREMQARGASLDQIDEALGFKRGRSRYIANDARNFSQPELEALLEKIITLEYNVKSGLVPLPAAFAAVISKA